MNEELELVGRCADGDEAAWEEFLRRYGAFLEFMIRRALSSARGRLPTPDEVADVKHEVLAWLVAEDGRVLRTYRGESKLTSWIGVLVGRRARRIAARGSALEHKTVSLDALTPDATSHLAVARGGDGEAAARDQALQVLATAIEGLSERDRVLLRGAFYDQRSYVELAEELGVRTDSIGQLLFRAKKKLKERLGGDAFLERLSGIGLALLFFLSRGR